MDDVLMLAYKTLPEGCHLVKEYLEAAYTMVLPYSDPDGVVRNSIVIFKPTMTASIAGGLVPPTS